MPGPYLGEPYDADYYLGGVPPNVMTLAGYTDYPAKESIVRGIADDIEAEIGLVSGLDVLDVGCAFGFLTDELAIRGASVEGLDISSFAIGEAQSRFPTRTFVEADAQATAYGSDSFDLAVVCGVAGCMPDNTNLTLLFQEMDRIVRPAGKMYWLFWEDRTPPFQYNQKTEAEWSALLVAGLSGRTAVVSNVGHLPVFYQYRALVS